jgi:hypothetical protein
LHFGGLRQVIMQAVNVLVMSVQMVDQGQAP